MTIAIAVRTGSAVVFAADSKITTRAIAGVDPEGEYIWQEQTYDNATKVVHDRNRTLMAMVAGAANIGEGSATDFIATREMEFNDNLSDQDAKISTLVEAMVERRCNYWKTTPVPPDQWPGTTIIMAAPKPNENVPRVWNITLKGDGSKISEILTHPGIEMEGSYDEIFTLMYGFQFDILKGFSSELGITDTVMYEAWRKVKVLRPIDKLNLGAMPIQDAIDMAVFLAEVQVQMDRFLPGTPACGGPIDVMVLQMAPRPGIIAYPGKIVHHPRGSQLQ